MAPETNHRLNFAIVYAWKFVLLPYRFGGDDPLGGYDCSGFVCEILSAVGLLPHKYDGRAQDIYYKLKEKYPLVTLERAMQGDIAFYGKNMFEITHTAFLTTTNLVLEAGGGDSATKDKADAEAQNAFVRMRPVTYRKDLVAILRPTY